MLNFFLLYKYATGEIGVVILASSFLLKRKKATRLHTKNAFGRIWYVIGVIVFYPLHTKRIFWGS